MFVEFADSAGKVKHYNVVRNRAEAYKIVGRPASYRWVEIMPCEFEQRTIVESVRDLEAPIFGGGVKFADAVLSQRTY